MCRILPAKATLLCELGLPYRVVWGTVEAIEIQLSWSSLFAKPIAVELTGVKLLLKPIGAKAHADGSTSADDLEL
jgi:hypothetical protein